MLSYKLINAAINGLNSSLEMGEEKQRFDKSKGFRIGMQVLIGLGFMLILIPMCVLFMIYQEEGSLELDSYFILMVPIMFIPLIGMIIPGYLKSNQSAILNEDLLTIELPNGMQEVDLKQLRQVRHRYLPNTVELITDSYYYELSKSIKGFENLYLLILLKSGIKTVEEGVVSRVVVNFYSSVGIIGYMMTVFFSFFFIAAFVELGFVSGFLVTVGGLILLWGLMALMALEFYVRYQFDKNGFTIIRPFSKKKVAYKNMRNLILDKARYTIYFKVRFDDYKVYVPLGSSLEDIYVFLLSKIETPDSKAKL